MRWRTADGVRLSTTEPPMSDLRNCSVRAIGADRGVAWATRSNVVVVWRRRREIARPQAGTSAGSIVDRHAGQQVRADRLYGQSLKWELPTGKLIGPRGHPWPGRSSSSSVCRSSPRRRQGAVYDYAGYGVHDGPPACSSS